MFELTVKALDLRVLIKIRLYRQKFVPKSVLHLSSLSSNIIQPLKSVSADGRQFFYCHSVILLPLGNSTATFHISTAMAVEIDFHFLVWQ